MMDSQNIRLGALAEERKERLGEDVEVIPVYGVNNKSTLTASAKYQSKDLKKYKVIENEDFAYNPMRLNIGSIGYCSKDFERGLVSPDYVVFRCNRDKLLPEYLKYYIFGAEWQNWVAKAGVGSVRTRIYFKELAKMKIHLPSIEYQKKVVSILSSLDLAINNLKSQNKLLDEITRKIFNHWFVDFKPTRAKHEAKINGLSPEELEFSVLGVLMGICSTEIFINQKHEINKVVKEKFSKLPVDQQKRLEYIGSLFPDHLISQGDKLVPSGWKYSNIYDFLEITYGAPFKSKFFNEEDEGEPLIRIRDFKTFKPKTWTTEKHSKAVKIKAGDLLVGMDAEFRATLWLGEEAYLNQRVLLVKPLGNISKAYLKNALIEPLKYFEKSKVGTTVIHLGKADVDSIELIMPCPELMKEYLLMCDTQIDKIVSNQKQVKQLNKAKNIVLNKALKGDLNLSEVELENISKVIA